MSNNEKLCNMQTTRILAIANRSHSVSYNSPSGRTLQ